MLFRKDIEPSCMYCKFGSVIHEEEVICLKKGIVSTEFRCRAFKYDPLKRVPQRPVVLDTSKLKEDDFKI